MRVAIVAESFLPNINGVTNSVLRVLEHLKEHGHEALVIAPESRDAHPYHDYLGFPVVGTASIMFPLVNSLPVGIPHESLVNELRAFEPDVVHLASPFVLGASAAFSAHRLGIPTVGVYQTDVAGFSTRYKLKAFEKASWDWTRTIHNKCDRTLAPSSVAVEALQSHGVNNVHRWGRGVDSVRFHPAKRSDALRRRWDPSGTKKIVGFVGRLAAEKGIARLAPLAQREDLKLVIVGNGPQMAELESLMPQAYFAGALGGDNLAAAYASFDVFVHAGEFETFCQTIQEAQAAGVPTIGPRAGGPIDLIIPGHNGELLEVATFERDVSGAVDRVLDPGVHEQLRRNARHGVEHKTWHAQCSMLMKHYREVIDQAPVAQPRSTDVSSVFRGIRHLQHR